MKEIVNIIKSKKYLLFFWSLLLIFLISLDGISAEFNSVGNYIQKSFLIIFPSIILWLFFSFYLSIKKQKIKYLLNSIITIFIVVISFFILSSNFGNKVTDLIRGNPKVIAEFRGIKLVLRENDNFDVWNSSFNKKVFSGSYKNQNNDLSFSFDNEIPNYLTTKAKIQLDEINRKVVRFNFTDTTRLDYYIIN